MEMEEIEKSFPGVRALDGVKLRLGAGEVLALMGENGAGKSTLIKVLSGAHRPDAGVVRVEGEEVDFQRPGDAQAAGIGVIYQELDLIPQLTVRENLFLGREKTSGLGFLKKAEEAEEARALFGRLGVELDPERKVGELSVAEQQVIEIAKALAVEAKVVVMDEPTAALSHREVERLFGIIGELKAQGIGIIYISHRMDEVERLADRVTVLRDGRWVGDLEVGEFDRDRVIRMMVGRSLEQEFPKVKAEVGEVLLRATGLERGRRVRGVSLVLRRGEVVGLTGLVGSGRTEVARLLFGADVADGGEVEIGGERVVMSTPRDGMAAGVCLLTEDRKGQGLVLGRSVRENFGLPNLRKFSRRGVLEQGRERGVFGGYVEQLAIRVPHQEQLAKNLSGGNQQKVVLAKWLEREAEVVIFDEPTRGIDVGAKVEIYQLMNRLVAEGKAVLMISSELPEVLGMSDRILVMREGEIVGEMENDGALTQEMVMEVAVG